MDPLISVIIPVYNVEKYLDRCIESVVNQTYTNLEIILVDDGSPDNCPMMCDAWAEKDSRIKVIHKKNGGAASARNIGLDNATGEYIGFVDSDDYIELFMFEELFKAISKNNADISLCANYEVNNDGLEIKKIPFEYGEECFSGQECLNKSFGNSYVHEIVCNKLYKSEMWADLRFPNYRKYEDSAILPFVYDKAQKIATIDKWLYYYQMVDGSIMHSDFDESDLVLIELERNILDNFSNREDIYTVFLERYLCILRGLLIKAVNDNANSSDYVKLHREFKRIYAETKKFNLKIKFSRRFAFVLLYISPRIYAKIIDLR